MRMHGHLLVAAAMVATATLLVSPLARAAEDTPHKLQGEIKKIDRDRSSATIKGEETLVTVRFTPHSNLVSKEKGQGSSLRDFHEGDKVMVIYAQDPEGGLLCLEMTQKGTKAYKEEHQDER